MGVFNMKNSLLFLLIFLWSQGAWASTYCSQAGACFLYNEGSGTTTTDNSGNGYNGTFQSSGHPAWTAIVPNFAVSGSAPNSLSYNGSSDYVTYGTSTALMQAGNPLTITFWMYQTATTSNSQALIGNINSGGSSGMYVITQTTNTNRDIDFAVKGSTVLNRDSNNSVYSLNTWVFVAVTWDGTTTASHVHIYVNNTEVGGYQTTTNGVSLASASGNTIITGNTRTGSTGWYDGYETNVSVFPSVLSSTALTTIYNYGLNYNPPTTDFDTIQGGSTLKGGTVIN